MLRSFVLIGFLFCFPAFSGAQSFDSEFVQAINDLRDRGCRCGGKWLKPAQAVRYNSLLSRSAYLHAVDIGKQRRLNHYSSRGLNIGERIEAVGYNWYVVGENLAFGHETIKEVIEAWIDSESHCRLLMDNRFDDVGFAKIGYYWVLHFGKLK